MGQIDYDIDDFMNYCEVKNLSQKIVKCYEQTLRLFASTSIILYLIVYSIVSKRN